MAATGVLNPMLAGAAMAVSSVFAVTNSLRLRRFRSLTSCAARSMVSRYGRRLTPLEVPATPNSTAWAPATIMQPDERSPLRWG